MVPQIMHGFGSFMAILRTLGLDLASLYILVDHLKVKKYRPILDLFYKGRVSLARHNIFTSHVCDVSGVILYHSCHPAKTLKFPYKVVF